MTAVTSIALSKILWGVLCTEQYNRASEAQRHSGRQANTGEGITDGTVVSKIDCTVVAKIDGKEHDRCSKQVVTNLQASGNAQAGGIDLTHFKKIGLSRRRSSSS